MKENEYDLRLWLADTKYGVLLLLMFFCISQPFARLQKIKQNWGLPGFHEVLYTPEIFSMFHSLKSIKTMKDLVESKNEALRPLLYHLKDLDKYKFGGVKLEHSPARFITKEVDGIPTIIRHSEPNFKEVIKFMHGYAEYNLEFIPKILEDCTHP